MARTSAAKAAKAPVKPAAKAAKPAAKATAKAGANPAVKTSAKPATGASGKPVAKAKARAVAAKAAPKAASQPVTKAVTKAVTKTVAKPVTKTVAKTVTKPARPKAAPTARLARDAARSLSAAVKGKAPARPESDARPVLVRDSFTMPEQEYAVLGAVKQACLQAGFEIKKSELLRIGVALLGQLDTQALRTVLDGLPQLKTGRPPAE